MKTRVKNKKIHGVGVNDADYPVRQKINGKQVTCQIYRTWAHMLERCYDHKSKERRPTYSRCTITEEWNSFMAFRSWMLTQDWEGNNLDKDILFVGNTIYSPETCVFVSSKLNSFIIDSAASRGDYPIGVYYCKQNRKYRARCNNPFTKKKEHLGLFTDPQSAYMAWRKRKHEHACMFAEAQQDIRISTALLTRYS